MLESLKVKNLALIENCELEFSEGLNILTGETGAGKSILLGSVNLALGARAEGNVIRNGADEALVELVFSNSPEVSAVLKEMDLPYEDESIIITRKITPTKSSFKINGETVVARQVKEIATELMDIHGQHEHQSLLNVKKQRDMIDAFGGEEIASSLLNVSALTKQYKEIKSEYEEALSKSAGRDREISLLEYEVNEIEEACLIPDEDEELEENYKRMQSSERLTAFSQEAIQYVSSDSGEDAGSLISHALMAMNRVVQIDDGAQEIEEDLRRAEEALGDFSIKLSRYIDNLEYDEEEFERVSERLNVINSLKMKFGNRIEDILSYCEQKKQTLDQLRNLEEYLAELKNKLSKTKEEYVSAATNLSTLRKKSAEEFSKQLTEALKELNFLDVKFEVSVTSDYEDVNQKGADGIEFMVSTNPGEPIKPVKDVASGGELSRIMLGIKSILAEKDNIDSLIFDEIDTGISGVTAREVGKKLSKLSKRHQVILITHLAQIAALADTHFIISKGVVDNKTTTSIDKVTGDELIHELARLLGGDSTSVAAINNAIELKENAERYV